MISNACAVSRYQALFPPHLKKRAWARCGGIFTHAHGVSGVNHSLAGGELSLLLYLAVPSTLYVLPSVWVYVSLSLVKRFARSWARSVHGVHVHVVCIDLACPVTSSYPSRPLEDVTRDSPRRPDAVVDYVHERTVSWCRLRITPYTTQIGIDNRIPEALDIYIHSSEWVHDSIASL